jgi:S-formylglutathione hydrolase FrmB
MKTLLLILTLGPLFCWGQDQFPQGQIVVERLTSEALKNSGGENPTRRITVYLPPDYDKTTNRYPVIYYLHGFTWSDSLQIASDHFDKLLDKAIATGKIRPLVVVMPNQHTLYRGSWYTNSTLTGNWSDFTAKDLVQFIDAKYRTIANEESRGIVGHSMGGYGAIKIGMQFPDVFSSVYALSPGLLGLVKDFGYNSQAFRRANKVQTHEELINYQSFDDVLANCAVAMGRTFTPNPANPPFYADLPFVYEGEKLKIDYEVLAKWNENSPIEMADNFVGNLKKLKAIKLDWGRNEEISSIPLSCQIFSQKLENLGVNHYAEEYIGTHGNKLWTDDGRALNDMLPFFNTYLTFEEMKYKTQETKKKK